MQPFPFSQNKLRTFPTTLRNEIKALTLNHVVSLNKQWRMSPIIHYLYEVFRTRGALMATSHASRLVNHPRGGGRGPRRSLTIDAAAADTRPSIGHCNRPIWIGNRLVMQSRPRRWLDICAFCYRRIRSWRMNKIFRVRRCGQRGVGTAITTPQIKQKRAFKWHGLKIMDQ